MKIGQCKLCLKEKELIKKSHIIPNFMYQGLFGEKHKLAVVNLKNTQKANFIFTGYYNHSMICSTCDNELLGGLEDYAKHILYNSDNKRFGKVTVEHFRGKDGLKTLFLKNIDYKKFKLFCISILWRVSISTNSFFKDIDLGKKYTERARDMIYNGDAGEEDEFMICILALKPSANLPLKSIIDPIRLTGEGNTTYCFYINGYFYQFNVSPYNRIEMYDKSTIAKDNTMQIAVLEGSVANGYFDSYAKQKLRTKTKWF